MPLRVSEGGDHFVGYNAQNACHFLDRDKLCSLHRKHGLSHKPLVCQVYPYNFVDTPGGIFVSLLYSCPSVVSGEGRKLRDAEEGLQKLFRENGEDTLSLAPVKEHILLTQQSTMTWEEYLDFERQVFETMEGDDPVDFLIKLLCFLLEEDSSYPLPQRETPLYFAIKDELLPDLASYILAYLEEFEDPESSHLFMEQIQTGNFPYSQRLQAKFPKFSLQRPFDALTKATISRYLRNQIHGKLLLIGPSLVCRLLLTLTAISILLYDLSLLRERDGVQENSQEHLRESFETCEEKLVAQTNALEGLLQDLEASLLDML